MGDTGGRLFASSLVVHFLGDRRVFATHSRFQPNGSLVFAVSFGELHPGSRGNRGFSPGEGGETVKGIEGCRTILVERNSLAPPRQLLVPILLLILRSTRFLTKSTRRAIAFRSSSYPSRPPSIRSDTTDMLNSSVFDFLIRFFCFFFVSLCR